ncbi:MAG: hypothetical protein PVH30_11720 [Desulfobacterales bacterium]
MNFRRVIVFAGILFVAFAAVPLPALSQSEGAGGQALDQAANDPTASLMNIQIQNIYTDSYHNLDDESGNTILLRSAVPFSTGPLDHIARATFPIITDSPAGESGVGDLVLFDLLVFNRSWGRWGFGPVALLPTASEDVLGAEKWALGPAVGFVALSRQLLWGVFNQNLFTVDGDKDRKDVNISNIQPIISYSLPRQWSIGTSEMNFLYDWEEDDWTAIPFGLKLAKLVTLSGMPVQFSGAYEYNFKDDYITPEWTVNFTVKFLFPVH